MLNLYTEQTEILHLEKQLFKTTQNICKYNLDWSKFSVYPYWYKKGEACYYFKAVNPIEALNHFICERIAPVFSLSSAHFVPASISNCYGIASENFRKKDITYCYPSSWDFLIIEDLLSYIQTGKFRESTKQFEQDLLRVIAFQIYTEWDDLHFENLMFQKEKNGYRVAPLFDFDYAFSAKENLSNYMYRSFLYEFLIPSKELETLLTQYPFFQDLLISILEIDMEAILREIETTWSLCVNELYWEHYKRQDELKKDLIRNLHL